MLNLPKAFTQSASKAMAQAQLSAASMGLSQVGSGHILLGLCRSADELTRCLIGDIPVREMEEAVAHYYKRGEPGFSRVTGMTPHANRILLRAMTYANPDKRSLAGTAHIWLELLCEEGCKAHAILMSLGKSIEGLKNELRNAAGEIERPERAKAIPASDEPLQVKVVQIRMPEAEEKAQADVNPLEAYARNLTQAAAENRLEPLIGREDELAMMIRVLGKKTKNNPLLIGEPGVGKTELCKALSEAQFGRNHLVRIDMSEYSEEASVSRLIGSPPGYVGHGDGGQLTDAVLAQPYSLVLFDEIEKAHPKVYNLLLQLLDDGQLTDSMGRKVNFRNTIVIMTSNAGVSFDMDKRLGFDGKARGDDPARRSKAILARTREVFRPEFLGRIDEIVVMNSLTAEDGRRIAALMLARVQQRMDQRGIELLIEPEVPVLLAGQGVDAMSGARNLRRIIQEQVENPLSELILAQPEVRRIVVSTENGTVSVHTCTPLLAAQ